MNDFGRLMAQALRLHLDTSARARVPAGGEMLWSWFSDLSLARSYHTNGPNPISWADIASYFNVMRVPMQPHNVAILMAMDRVFLDSCLPDDARAPEGVKTSPRISTQPISADLFDALFG